MPKKKAEKNGKGTAEEVAALSIPKIAIHKMYIKLIGDSALISHAWSDKAKAMMLGKQMGKAKAKKEPKDPEQDYQDSLYPHPDGGYGFPAVAFWSRSMGSRPPVKTWCESAWARQTSATGASSRSGASCSPSPTTQTL